MERTYLHHCLKNDLTVRWPDGAMPINVYIAPFQWYEKSKQQEALLYRQMVMDALDSWSQLSGGMVRYRVVGNLQQSQVDVKWRRVDRQSLGHCEYMVNDRSMIYSAEIQIGISDGRVHARYNNTDEVKHTILHEVGHSLGLVGHSDHPHDMMYVPHQYGVTAPSARDVETLRWLYKLPVAFDYQQIGKKYRLPEPFTFHQVLDQIEGNTNPKQPFQPPKPPAYKEQAEVLNHQHQILSDVGKFNLSIQNIQLPQDLKQQFIQKNLKPPHKPN